MRAVRCATLLPVLMLGLLATRAQAQYSVTQSQPLAFGYLMQGVTEIVPFTDTFRRGVVAIDGTGRPYVRLILPASLASAQGGTAIPLQFLNGDVASQESGKKVQAFDPATSQRVNLAKGTAYVYIGGRATPSANQRAGVYTATTTVIVSLIQF